MRMQLAAIDYDKVHEALVQKCQSVSPNMTPALMTAIDTWRTQNQAALEQLRALFRETVVKTHGLSASQASAQQAKLAVVFTNQFKTQFEKIPVQELKAACDGQYAEQSLTSPMLNFNAWLAKMRGRS